MPSSPAFGPTAPAEGALVPKRVWGATVVQVLGRVAGAVCTLATLGLLARSLSTDAFGRYTFYLVVIALLDGVTDFGTGHAAVQRSASDAWAVPAVLAAGRRLRWRTATLGVVAVALWVALADEPGGAWIVLAACYQWSHVAELSATVFRNRIAWGIPVGIRLATRVSTLGLTWLLVASGVRLAAIHVATAALCSTLGNLALHRAARPLVPRPTIAVRADRGLLAAAWPLGLTGLAQLGFFYVDNLFVRGIEGDAALGRYNGGVRMMSFLIMVAQMATLAALPWLVRRHAAGELGEATARLAQPLFAASALAAGLLWPWSGALLALVLGEDFRAAGASFGWLLLAVPAIYAGAPLVTALVGAARNRAVLAVSAAALALNLAGNALLVPRLGIEGAAIATVATEVAVAAGACACLVAAGAAPRGPHPWRWLAAPPLFALAALLSSRLPFAP